MIAGVFDEASAAVGAAWLVDEATVVGTIAVVGITAVVVDAATGVEVVDALFLMLMHGR